MSNTEHFFILLYYKSQKPNSWISPSNPFKYFSFENSQSLVPIEKDGNYGYIDINNVIKIPAAYNLAKGFREGAAPIKINDKWGYINHIGQVIIPFQFDDADLFYDGLACIKCGVAYGYFNINGDMIIPPLQFTVAGKFEKGLARVEDTMLPKTEHLSIGKPRKHLVTIQMTTKIGKESHGTQ